MDAPDWIPSGATRAAYCLMQNAAVPRLPDPVLIMHGFHDRCSRGGERDGDLFEAAVKRIREETGDYSRPAWLLVYESPLDGGYPGAWMNSWR